MTESSNENNNESNNDNKKLASSVYCYCNHALSCTKCGKPMASKADTKFVIESLYSSERPPQSNVFGNGPLLLSDVPKSAREGQVVVGIDEAGRGSSLGPMVYGMAYWSASDSVQQQIPKGFHDSKQLSEDTRFRLFDQILQHTDIGFGMRSLLPSEISRNMLRTKPYNLNEMSHDTAILLIRKLLDSGVQIKTAFIDTVGNPEYYKRKLEREFPGVDFVVESKADANYAPCSASSVVAKVMRDRMADGWKFSEPGLKEVLSTDYGSGYPSDPKCKAWMEDLHDPVFGYSDVLRFSWAPTKNKLLEKGVSVTFKADLDDADEIIEQQKGMTAFLGKKRKRLGYFEKRHLEVVTKVNRA